MNLLTVLALCFTALHIALVVCMTKLQFQALCLSWGIGIPAGIIGLGLTFFTSHVVAASLLCAATMPSFACTSWILQNVTFRGDSAPWWQRRTQTVAVR